MTARFLPQHLSVSSVALYTQCPAQWRRRYVDGVVDPPTAAQATGIAFHRALESLHRGDDPALSWLRHADAAENALAENGRALTMSKLTGIQLLSAYRAAGYADVLGEPERKIRLPFPSPKIPVPLLCYLDLAVPAAREYRDFKTTGGTSWNAAKVALEPQLHVYGWAYQRTYGHRAERALWCVFNTQNVTLDVYEAAPSPDLFRVFEQQAEMVWTNLVEQNYDGCGHCWLCRPRVAAPPSGPRWVWPEASSAAPE